MKNPIISVASFCSILSISAVSAANIQSDRWFHEVKQEGRDVHITLQLIEEDQPAFDTTFTLKRGTEKTIFEGMKFEKKQADDTQEYGCVTLQFDEVTDDCDGDGENECNGICGTAYRYYFVDECVVSEHVMYNLWDESTQYENGPPVGDGIYYVFDLDPVDDPCLHNDNLDTAGESAADESDASCSTVPVGGSEEAGLALAMVLLGLGVFLAAGRKHR